MNPPLNPESSVPTVAPTLEALSEALKAVWKQSGGDQDHKSLVDAAEQFVDERLRRGYVEPDLKVREIFEAAARLQWNYHFSYGNPRSSHAEYRASALEYVLALIDIRDIIQQVTTDHSDKVSIPSSPEATGRQEIVIHPHLRDSDPVTKLYREGSVYTVCVPGCPGEVSPVPMVFTVESVSDPDSGGVPVDALLTVCVDAIQAGSRGCDYASGNRPAVFAEGGLPQPPEAGVVMGVQNRFNTTAARIFDNVSGEGSKVFLVDQRTGFHHDVEVLGEWDATIPLPPVGALIYDTRKPRTNSAPDDYDRPIRRYEVTGYEVWMNSNGTLTPDARAITAIMVKHCARTGVLGPAIEDHVKASHVTVSPEEPPRLRRPRGPGIKSRFNAPPDAPLPDILDGIE